LFEAYLGLEVVYKTLTVNVLALLMLHNWQ